MAIKRNYEPLVLFFRHAKILHQSAFSSKTIDLGVGGEFVFRTYGAIQARRNLILERIDDRTDVVAP